MALILGNPSASIEPIKAVFCLSIMPPTVFSTSFIINFILRGYVGAKVSVIWETVAIKMKEKMILFKVYDFSGMRVPFRLYIDEKYV